MTLTVHEGSLEPGGSPCRRVLPRFAESLVTQLACFKLAAAAILPDSDFPAERIRFMIDDAAAAAVLTSPRTPPP